MMGEEVAKNNHSSEQPLLVSEIEESAFLGLALTIEGDCSGEFIEQAQCCSLLNIIAIPIITTLEEKLSSYLFEVFDL